MEQRQAPLCPDRPTGLREYQGCEVLYAAKERGGGISAWDAAVQRRGGSRPGSDRNPRVINPEVRTSVRNDDPRRAAPSVQNG